MKRTLLIICLLIGLYPNYILKASGEYFRHYSNKQGMPHNTVYCSIQDNRGFIWFGTDNGLCRFDGYEFRIYRSVANDSTALPNNIINSLFEDSKGRIWVSTDSYTCYYDCISDKFYPIILQGEDSPKYYSRIIEDSDNNLWFINTLEIIKLGVDDLNGEPKRYEAKNMSPRVVDITEEGSLLIGGRSDIWWYRESSDSFENVEILDEKEKSNLCAISAICVVPNRGVLVGMDDSGLKFYDKNKKTVESILQNVIVRDIMLYSENICHVGTEEGVFVFDMTDWSVKRYQKSLTDEYSISDNAVYSVMKDKEGGVWYGSYFGGVDYLPSRLFPMRYYIAGKTHKGMKGNTVREMCRDGFGNLWLATEDNGVNCLNMETGKMLNYSHDNANGILKSTNIHGVLADGDLLWIGTYNDGIEIMNLKTRKIVKRYDRDNTNGKLSSNFVLCFRFLSDDEILIGTSVGVSKYDKRSGLFEIWNKDITCLVREVYIDRSGEIWVSSINGIYQCDKYGNTRSHYKYDSNDNESLCGNSTTSIFEDSNGRIWITTIDGVALLDKSTGKFERITRANGLPTNVVYRIEEDNDKNLWMSTANGLVRFNPETRQIKIFSYAEGLPQAQFNYSSSFKDTDGTIYMGTIEGMIAFNPKDFKDDTYCPDIYFTNLSLQGNAGEDLGRKVNSMLNSGRIVLPYDQASFTISFVALNYTSPEAIQYAYMLEGVDAKWIKANRSRDVSFANLSPGDYILKVKSTNSSGIWQSNEASIRIIIKPPFWLTGYALTIYVLLSLFALYLFFRYKRKKLIEKHEHEKILFEGRKEKELYDMKMHFFTSVTHEIKTPLTLIKAPLEKIISSGDGTEETKHNLKLIERNTHRLLDLCLELLDFRKIESEGITLSPENTEIVMWVKTILQTFYPTYEKEHKSIEEKIPKEPFYAEVDRNAFSKIIGNMLSNAMKYSDSFVSLELIAPDASTGNFSLIVSNDGDLIPENETSNIFNPFYRTKGVENKEGSGIGLSLSRTLAELHGGEIIYTVKDGLNVFVLTLPQYRGALKEDVSVPAIQVESSAKSKNEDVAVLIAEDQDDMREFVAKELSVCYRVYKARNGKVALEILEKNTVNIIVSDVMMPEMNGFELCDEVKSDINNSHIPIILLTAQYNDQSRLKGLNTGADAYMEKPFSVELLKAQINNLLKNRSQLAQMYMEKPHIALDVLATSKVDNAFLKKFQEYLDEHITEENLSIEELSEAMNISSTSLYRKVKMISGLPPKEFLRVARLKKAVALMNAGETRVNEIAYRVGFGSSSYFSTCFMKQYGKSPKEYIREIAAE